MQSVCVAGACMPEGGVLAERGQACVQCAGGSSLWRPNQTGVKITADASGQECAASIKDSLAPPAAEVAASLPPASQIRVKLTDVHTFWFASLPVSFPAGCRISDRVKLVSGKREKAQSSGTPQSITTVIHPRTHRIGRAGVGWVLVQQQIISISA